MIYNIAKLHNRDSSELKKREKTQEKEREREANRALQFLPFLLAVLLLVR